MGSEAAYSVQHQGEGARARPVDPVAMQVALTCKKPAHGAGFFNLVRPSGFEPPTPTMSR